VLELVFVFAAAFIIGTVANIERRPPWIWGGATVALGVALVILIGFPLPYFSGPLARGLVYATMFVLNLRASGRGHPRVR